MSWASIQEPLRQVATWVLGLVAISELLGRLGRLHPLLELISNLRTHQLTGAIVVFVVLAATGSKASFIAALFVLLPVIQLAPYWFASPDPAFEGGTDFAVMQFNIPAENRNFAGGAIEIKNADPDVIVINELTSEQWTQISDRLPEYEHTMAEPWDQQEANPGGGMAILSRHPLSPESFPASISRSHRPVLAASINIGGHEVLVIGMHPHASRTKSAKVDLRKAQLNAVADRVNDHNGLAVVAGDLNLTPTSTQYREFLGDLGWRDPHRSVGWNATWWFRGLPLGLPIDHILVSDAIALLAYDVGAGTGSDHKSLVARLSLPPG